MTNLFNNFLIDRPRLPPHSILLPLATKPSADFFVGVATAGRCFAQLALVASDRHRRACMRVIAGWGLDALLPWSCSGLKVATIGRSDQLPVTSPKLSALALIGSAGHHFAFSFTRMTILPARPRSCDQAPHSAPQYTFLHHPSIHAVGPGACSRKGVALAAGVCVTQLPWYVSYTPEHTHHNTLTAASQR